MNIPEADVVVKDLSHLWPHITAAMEHGTNKAREFHEREAKDGKINPFLAPDLVRYHAKEHLEGVAEKVGFTLSFLSNNGLCISCGRYRLRILKADEGGTPPAPGSSAAKQQFYRQLSIKFTTEEGAEVLEDVVNILVLWEVTYPYNLMQLYVACPKNGDEKKAEVYWEEPLPFVPKTIVEVEPVPQEEDLPLTLNQPATGTGETE